MGLDMFLIAKTRVDKAFLSSLGYEPTPHTYGVNIDFVCAYWRKANAIHRWFVENVQNGEDDCKEYPVNREQFTELINLCKTVVSATTLVPATVHVSTTYTKEKTERVMEPGLAVQDPSVAMKLLPSQVGFFFGSEQYTEWYIKSLKETINQLEKILTPQYEKCEFFYQASW